MKNVLIGVSAAVVFLLCGFIGGIWLTHSMASHRPTPLINRHASAARHRPRMASAPKKRKILYWWDPMLGRSSISSKPGVSAMGMKLVPVYAPRNGVTSGSVVINPVIEQDMGVQTAVAHLGPLTQTIRTVGYVRRAAPQITRVVLRIGGYVGHLYATTNGQSIHAGATILTLYSPKLLTDEKEMLAAYHLWQSARGTGDRAAASAELRLFHALVNRLINLGVPGSEVRRIVVTNHANKYLPFSSPASGEVKHILIRQRSYVSHGQTLMEITNLSSLWIDAHVYDDQMAWVKPGNTMRVLPNSLPGRILRSSVNFISPSVNRVSHTVIVRGDLSNADAALRPGMTATVYIKSLVRKAAILIPRDAVIETGIRNVVLIADGHGHFHPVNVKVGLPAAHGMVEILSGIGPGQKVVTSGEFLIDVESQMRSAESNFSAAQPVKHAAKPRGTKSAEAKMNMPMPKAKSAAVH